MEIQNKMKNNQCEWDILEFIFTLIVDWLVTISFCTSVTDSSIKSVVVLFGLTYFSSFFEQRKNYRVQSDKQIEKTLADWGCIMSILLLTVCVMVGVGFLHLDVRENRDIILGSAYNSVIDFDTKDITYISFLYLHYPVVIHFLSGGVKWLKIQDYDVSQMLQYIKARWKIIIGNMIVSAFSGMLLCDMKFFICLLNPKNGSDLGEPQYLKYAILFAVLGASATLWLQIKKCMKFQKDY